MRTTTQSQGSPISFIVANGNEVLRGFAQIVLTIQGRAVTTYRLSHSRCPQIHLDVPMTRARLTQCASLLGIRLLTPTSPAHNQQSQQPAPFADRPIM